MGSNAPAKSKRSILLRIQDVLARLPISRSSLCTGMQTWLYHPAGANREADGCLEGGGHRSVHRSDEQVFGCSLIALPIGTHAPL